MFGALLGAGGVAYLALTLGHWAAAATAAATFVLYVGVYTPLKSRTTLNTLVGAVPGALPPLIGWAAVRGGLTWEALPLFLIVFLWQVPHFLAIAWIYRDQYARAGLRMLPVFDRTGRGTGWRMVGYCLALLPASLAPLLVRRRRPGLRRRRRAAGPRLPGVVGRLPARALDAAGAARAAGFAAVPARRVRPAVAGRGVEVAGVSPLIGEQRRRPCDVIRC